MSVDVPLANAQRGAGHTPYASAIVPTHDRAGTLPVAIAAIQRQTVADIEILIVGDGASPEARAAAQSIAASDGRVRFLDFEKKAPRDAGANIDRALELVRSDRIFYCDDDDVWLPQHIETIGPHLDRSDVVDTLPVSIGLCPVGETQRLHGLLVNGGNPQTRSLLAERRLKLIFDTHLAHRKSSYEAVGRPWAGPADSSLDRFLSAFAGTDTIRWTTLPIPTALSLHGIGRTYMGAADRVVEIRQWFDRTSQWNPRGLLREADFTWHLVHTLLAVPPNETESIITYAAGMGIGWHQGPETEEAGILRPDTLSDQQRRALELAFALFQGEAVESDDLKTLIPRLLDVVLGTFISINSATRILRPFGKARGLEIVRGIRREQPESAHLTGLFEGHLLAKAKEFHAAREIADQLAEDGKLPGYDLSRLLMRIDLAEGKADAAVARVEKAWRMMPKVTVIGLDLATTLIAANRKAEALSLCKELETRLPPNHPGLQNRYRLLGHDQQSR